MNKLNYSKTEAIKFSGYTARIMSLVIIVLGMVFAMFAYGQGTVALIKLPGETCDRAYYRISKVLIDSHNSYIEKITYDANNIYRSAEKDSNKEIEDATQATIKELRTELLKYRKAISKINIGWGKRETIEETLEQAGDRSLRLYTNEMERYDGIWIKLVRKLSVTVANIKTGFIDEVLDLDSQLSNDIESAKQLHNNNIKALNAWFFECEPKPMPKVKA